jgi:hypothetical protein
MPLPNGDWDITSGGSVGTLTLNQAADGSVSGTVSGNPAVGFFDETAQTLALMSGTTLISTGGFNNVLATPFTVFRGSFFQFTAAGQTFSVLSGVSYINTGSGSVAYTVWYAQNPAPVKVSKEGKDGKEHKDGKDKEQKDGKDKEGKDKEGHEMATDHASRLFVFRSNASEAEGIEALGRCFIDLEQRPAVGEAALQIP